MKVGACSAAAMSAQISGGIRWRLEAVRVGNQGAGVRGGVRCHEEQAAGGVAAAARQPR